MAKRRNQYVFPGQRPVQLDRMDQSRFWQRLDELSRMEKSEDRKRAIDHLKASIRKITERAKWISTQVCRFMPQYTLHEERHFLNVLAIMDALVPDDVIAQFEALDCGLPILAAYTHDLGMAPSQDEYDRLHDESTEQGKHFASYRTRFDEELRQLERWKKRRDELCGNTDPESQQEAAAARKRIESIEGHILASYLRETHTENDQIRRLRRWLDIIKQETGDENVFRYGVGGKDYQRELALIGISHGRGAPWLRRQMIDSGPDDRFFQPVATGESVNLAFPGLLLRLADVMDFDASRAPRILFKHFGIENDQSVLEWNRHLSVVGWRLDVDPDGKQQPDLLYSAECQHPVHEKAICDFKTWIDVELSAVRIELDAQRRQLPAAAQDGYDLHLPSQTRLDIRAARDSLTDQPKYVYHDLQFRLDQDEIQQLLMGESLYGDPGLCIRELLQNALDALELRELRLKMKQKGEAREPVDGELIRPGWVREPDGREEELRVTLDWGTDDQSGQQWLRVTDNGVGMTEKVIKDYFTQIGKSYYRSPEFNQERAAMKAAGEAISPISIFGIGVLSCFMIADRIHVKTHAGANGDSGSRMTDVIISGPGSLFWLKRGSREGQGTEIKLLLKPRFSIRHDKDNFEQELRNRFGYDGTLWHEEPSVDIDPPFLAAAFVVWPKYPISVQTGEGKPLRIDELFHADRLVAIQRWDVVNEAAKWGCPNEFIHNPRWGLWDWIDNQGDSATGSRFRLWFPTDSPRTSIGHDIPTDSEAHDHCRQFELAAFVEPQLSHKGKRVFVTVKGMYVVNMPVNGSAFGLEPSVGSRLWIDLAGPVSPDLTVDRRTAIEPDYSQRWPNELKSLVARFVDHVRTELVAKGPSGVLHNLRATFKWPDTFQTVEEPTGQIDVRPNCGFSWWAESAQKWTTALDSTGFLDKLIVAFTSSTRELNMFSSLGSKLFIDFRESMPGTLEHGLLTEFVRKEPDYAQVIYGTFFQGGAYTPNRREDQVVLNGFLLSADMQSATMIAPCLIKAGATNQGGPLAIEEWGYDLVLPFVLIPIGNLRDKCKSWTTDRRLISLGVAPFLLTGYEELRKLHSAQIQQQLGVSKIQALLPKYELWDKPFDSWSKADWSDRCLSAFWDIASGAVLWTRGRSREIQKVGKRAEELF